MKTPEKSGIILVDADSIYFRAAYKMRKADIRKSINTYMKDIETCTFTDQMKVAVKGAGNFRYKVYPEYKANRNRDYDRDFREALNYGHQYMLKRWSAIQADGMEADDLVCIWAHECMELDIPYVIAGIDKDLYQIPGLHYNFIKQEFIDVNIDTAYRNLMVQCLTGDTSDNIPGIKGIGPVKAERILRGIPGDMLWDRVCSTYRDRGLPDPDVYRRLVTMIKTWEEFDEVQTRYQTTVSQQDVLPEQEEDTGLSSVSRSDQASAGDSELAVREQLPDNQSSSGTE